MTWHGVMLIRMLWHQNSKRGMHTPCHHIWVDISLYLVAPRNSSRRLNAGRHSQISGYSIAWLMISVGYNSKLRLQVRNPFKRSKNAESKSWTRLAWKEPLLKKSQTTSLPSPECHILQVSMEDAWWYMEGTQAKKTKCSMTWPSLTSPLENGWDASSPKQTRKKLISRQGIIIQWLWYKTHTYHLKLEKQD